jgi:glutamate 5-kinase
MNSREIFAQARRVVIKVGSALLVDSASGALNTAWLSAICEDIAVLSKEGKQVLLVSSGAVALGRGALELAGTSLTLPQKQACAAAGQTILTRAYADAMRPLGLTTAQALLTLEDTENRRRWLNARATLTTLLELGIIPIINENDTVATDEIRYGDNDRLAARTAQMISADSLILLSDIDGLYTRDPRTNPGAEHLPFIAEITPDVIAMGGGVNLAAGMGSGGMATKLAAAHIAAAAGCHMCVMDGTQPSPISRLRAGAKCTWFAAADAPQNARRRWIGGTLDIKGTLSLDAGAVRALSRGKSLLAAGVSRVSGAFKKGDTVSLLSPDGTEIARGLISYDARETQAILGKNSAEISAVLGYDNGAALVHRDNLVVTGL